MTARRGERVLGPYEQPNGWRVIVVCDDGTRLYRLKATEREAQRYAELMRAEQTQDKHTTATSLELYKAHLAEKGNKEESTDVTAWAVGTFFPEPLALHMLTAKRCEALYEQLRTRPSERTKKPLAADTHRNVLAQVKSFLAWCVERGWLRANPLAGVKGIGKRRPRGKSLGKEGTELRIRDARAWYAKALELADDGDQGAIAALVALLLGMRASEIVSRRVADLESDEAPADTLWIPCSKTPAGRRTLEVPEVLRPMLLWCVEGKADGAHVFETEEGKPHWRDWIIGNVHRICDAVGVPRVTAHAMRGLNATISADRGVTGHLIAAHLGHESERTTKHAYASPGSFDAGARRRGLVVLSGGKLG